MNSGLEDKGHDVPIQDGEVGLRNMDGSANSEKVGW
jgi:hypothetical protein